MGTLAVERLVWHELGPVDLCIAAGDCVYLSGPSGAGKSLLLRALADLDPHQGRVALDGQAQEELPAPVWRRRVGLLPAESAWWEDAVGPHFQDGAVPWLRALGFDAAVLDWSVRRLSSGERQRLALARLLARRPAALLLDEPTANLDPASAARVEAAVARARDEDRVAVLWVGHDAGQGKRVAGRRLRLEDGRLAAGDPA